jgi:oxygen-dependent protoporphyrinogen oxidase
MPSMPKGMSELPEALAQQLHVRLSTPVTRVEPRGNGVMVEAAGEQQEYDAAVLATPAPISANIYPSATAAQKDILNTTTYATTVSIAYTLPAGTMPKDQSIFWVPYTENPHISSYTNEMMKGIPMTCVWLHEEYAKQIIGKSDEEIYRLVAQEMPRVADWLPSPDVLKPYDIQRWPLAMPKFAPGSIARVAKFVTSPEQGAQNVFLCGDYLNAPWTEGALRCGQRVAKQVIASAKRQ